jgi:hypothetical protein
MISLFLSIVMILGAMPLEMVYGQDTFSVKAINLYRTFEDLSDSGTYGISITGENLSKVAISYQEEASDVFIPLANPLPGSDDYFRQFRVDPGVIVSKIRVGNKVFNINETFMPKVTSIVPKQTDISKPDAFVTLSVQNFDNFGIDGTETTKIKLSNINLTDDFEAHVNNSVTLNVEDLNKLQHGIKHITIEKKTNEDGVDISTTYNQRNAFRTYESIDISEEDVTIFPNRGKIGTEVNITIKEKKEKYSVFFLEDETIEGGSFC